MTVEACIKCGDIKTSLSFYTEILDFLVHVPPDPEIDSFMSKYALLKRNNSFVHLSSHEGDGVFGNLIYVRTDQIDELYESFIARGLNTKEPTKYPALAIELTNQTWGMKEFAVRDPDGNRITFGQEI